MAVRYAESLVPLTLSSSVAVNSVPANLSRWIWRAGGRAVGTALAKGGVDTARQTANTTHLEENIDLGRSRHVGKVAAVLERGLARLGVVLFNLVLDLAVERRLVVDSQQRNLPGEDGRQDGGARAGACGPGVHATHRNVLHGYFLGLDVGRAHVENEPRQELWSGELVELSAGGGRGCKCTT